MPRVQALFVRPTILLLDEPTNHLDLGSCVWLEDHLKTYEKILLITSHSQVSCCQSVRVHACTYLCMRVYMFVSLFPCVCNLQEIQCFACMYACMYVCYPFGRILRLCSLGYTHICTHTHTHGAFSECCDSYIYTYTHTGFPERSMHQHDGSETAQAHGMSSLKCASCVCTHAHTDKMVLMKCELSECGDCLCFLFYLYVCVCVYLYLCACLSLSLSLCVFMCVRGCM